MHPGSRVAMLGTFVRPGLGLLCCSTFVIVSRFCEAVREQGRLTISTFLYCVGKQRASAGALSGRTVALRRVAGCERARV